MQETRSAEKSNGMRQQNGSGYGSVCDNAEKMGQKKSYAVGKGILCTVQGVYEVKKRKKQLNKSEIHAIVNLG